MWVSFKYSKIIAELLSRFIFYIVFMIIKANVLGEDKKKKKRKGKKEMYE